MLAFLSLLFYAVGIALIVLVVMQRKDPAATLAWILVIVFIPVVGVLLYLWFGHARIWRRVIQRQRSNEAIASHLEIIDKKLKEFQILPASLPLTRVQSDLIQITERNGAHLVTHSNSFHFITEPVEAFTELENAISGAKQSIVMEYYIFRRDGTGRSIMNLLAEAALRGVRVKLLVDGIGSWTLSAGFAKALTKAGGKFAKYAPVSVIGRPWHWNLRNHRKIAVIDGSVGYVGSANIGDEYRNRSGSTADFYDVQIRCTGPVVGQLEEVFAGDWFFATGENILSGGIGLPMRSGASMGQVISGGPDQEHHALHEMICTAFYGAEKSIRIVTPYFIPDQALMLALHTAAMRGVHVELMTARHFPSFHESLIFYAGRSYYPDLLCHGIRIFEYLPGFLHAKSILVDGVWGTVGTANMDIRSLRLNFEVNINFYDKALCTTLEKSFAENLTKCEEILPDQFARRSFGTRSLENSLRVFSPIL